MARGMMATEIQGNSTRFSWVSPHTHMGEDVDEEGGKGQPEGKKARWHGSRVDLLQADNVWRRYGQGGTVEVTELAKRRRREGSETV